MSEECDLRGLGLEPLRLGALDELSSLIIVLPARCDECDVMRYDAMRCDAKDL